MTGLVGKSGKSASHIYARFSLLQLIPEVAKVFLEERIAGSHANLIARLPQEHHAEAFENYWRKYWLDKEAHLLAAKHLSSRHSDDTVSLGFRLQGILLETLRCD
jgi:ParB family chromosome partitioning protein